MVDRYQLGFKELWSSPEFFLGSWTYFSGLPEESGLWLRSKRMLAPLHVPPAFTLPGHRCVSGTKEQSENADIFVSPKWDIG